MMGTVVILVFILLLFFALLVYMARTEGKQGPPPMQTKSLREIESTLLDIQRFSTDTYASGKASECADKVRRVLDGK